jgi:hypothetical protein
MKSILKLFVFSLFGASLFMGCNQGAGVSDAKIENPGRQYVLRGWNIPRSAGST